MKSFVFATGAAIAGLALAGCAGVGTQADPAPTVTITERERSTQQEYSSSEDVVVRVVLENAWSEVDAETKESICWLYNIDPDEAYDAFDSEEITKRQFEDFFDDVC